MSTVPEKVQRNVLTNRQTYLAARWFEEQAFERGATRPDVARRATEALGFLLTEGNIRGLEDTTGKPLPPLEEDADRLAALETNVALDRQHVDEQLNDLIKQVASLSTRVSNFETLSFATGQMLVVLEGYLQPGNGEKLKAELFKRSGNLRGILSDMGQFPLVITKPIGAK